MYDPPSIKAVGCGYVKSHIFSREDKELWLGLLYHPLKFSLQAGQAKANMLENLTQAVQRLLMFFLLEKHSL